MVEILSGILNCQGRLMDHFNENITPYKATPLEKIIGLPSEKCVNLTYYIYIFCSAYFLNLTSS